MTRHGDDYASDDEVAAAEQIQNASPPGSTRKIMSEKELQAIYEDFQNGAGFVWRDTWQNANRGTVNGFRRVWKGYQVQIILTEQRDPASGRFLWSWGIWQEGKEDDAVMGQRLVADVNTALRIAFAKWAEASGTAPQDVIKQWWKSARESLAAWRAWQKEKQV